MKRLSITTKITIWYTVFLLVITGCLLGILLYSGNTQASQAAKTRLMDAVMDASEEIEAFGGDFIIDKDLVFYEDGVYISVYDAKGGLVEGRRPAELPQLPAFADKEIRRMQDDAGDIWYIYDSSFEIDGESIWVRGIAKDFAEQGTFAFMMRLAAVAFPALAVLAAIGGFMITRRGFRPVRRILETVEEISRDGDLSRRVELDEKRGAAVDRKEVPQDRTPKDEIHKLAATFNSMFGKLERSFQQEKQFTSDVSHELRTPLAVIISQSDYAMEDAEYREQALKTINREARRMSGLVNRLLTLARSDAGRLKLEKERIDFSSMCETIAQQQEPAAEEKRIRIETDLSPGIAIQGDETMLIRVLLNLMENAVKYGKKGGRIMLELTEEKGFAKCSVADDGIGIAAGDLEKIWERFYRVDASRSEEGAGLGLSMVNALVKAHDGRTEVYSVPGEGSCFTIYLPLAEDAGGDTEQEGMEVDDGKHQQ